MKKYLLILSILTALLLAACGTESQTEEPSPTDDSNGAPVENPSEQEEIDGDDAVEEEETEENTEDPATEENPTNDVQSITYKSNNQEIKGSTTNTQSPQQDYHIDLMDGFTITAEEPGRDVVMADVDPDVSMRIEAFPKADIVFEELLTNTSDMVEASLAGEDYNEYDLSSIQLDEQITNMHTFFVEYEGETVLTLLYERPDKFIRLTIFDNDADLKDALVKMGLTIK
ncbi:hypothetical protein [Metasolibacillus sp.]|uniref:hypothetical protein n=1 Tax=Metasolibacillus sp. TaxID=2703680 RepID=UPI0025D71FAE|nr:hypothetical protein [Metasolibacillus sp.]MCT6924129.1 hypothetical protein [Metasolibacillus sp.]MCT6940236.1 hypothetical protein [Metasolibacillus sp.]